MEVKFYQPHILLRDSVNCIMVIHAEADLAGGPVICPYPPTPQNSLFFYINDRVYMRQDDESEFILQPRSVMVGPQLTRVSLDIQRSHKAVRVGFHPGGLYRLLGLSLSTMVDESYDAIDVFGKEMEEVNERLQEANDFDEIHQVIEQFLLGRKQKLKESLPFDLAMLELLKYDGQVSIEKLAALSCLSLRQFERVCKDRIGLPPKLFARLVRFSKAYRIRENNAGISWTQIAHTCGYFDQMHLIRDFKEFAGVAPGVIERDLLQTPVRLQAGLRL